MRLQRFDELYARDIPNLDQKANFLIFELAGAKQLDDEFTQEGTAALKKIGAQVGNLCVRLALDSEKFQALEKEKAEEKASFEAKLNDKDVRL